MDAKETKKLTHDAIRAAAREAAEYKSAIAATDTHTECVGVNEVKGHSDASMKQHLAQQKLFKKVDDYLKSHGVDTTEPKRTSDNSEGHKLKNDIIAKVEQEGHKEAHKKLHPKGDEVATCPRTPNLKKGGQLQI